MLNSSRSPLLLTRDVLLTTDGKQDVYLKALRQRASRKVPKNRVTEKKKMSGAQLHQMPDRRPPNLKKENQLMQSFAAQQQCNLYETSSASITTLIEGYIHFSVFHIYWDYDCRLIKSISIHWQKVTRMSIISLQVISIS